jgi:hypothetical protein
MFGTPLEQIWGKKKFIFFYISAGLGAALLQILVYHIDIISVSEILSEKGYSNGEIYQLLYERNSVPDEKRIINGIRSARALMVGASGALYGILVAFAMLFPNVKLMLLFPPIPIKAKYFVPILISIDLFSGLNPSFSMGPIAHFAHVGGAIGPIEKEGFKPENKSIEIRIGTKYFALIGMGGKRSISFTLGKSIAKATNIPYKAPDAPTIRALADLIPLIILFSSGTEFLSYNN